MHNRRFQGVALAASLTLSGLAPGALAADAMQWTFSEVNDPDNKGALTARLTYGDPETGNIQVSGVCDGRPRTGAAFSSVSW
jgi:hypothetical protein